MAYRIDGSSAVTSKPTRGAAGPNPDSYFQDTDSGGGTRLEADWLNMTQDEFATLVENAGLTLDKFDDTQVYQALVKYFNGTSTNIINPFMNYALLRHEESTGVAGGNSVTGTWNTCTLNTQSVNRITGLGLSTNVITFPAGTYRIKASKYVYQVGRAQLALYNQTATSFDIIGMSQKDTANDNDGSLLTFTDEVTFGVSTNCVIQAYSELTKTEGLGTPSSSGQDEVYGDVEIWKLD